MIETTTVIFTFCINMLNHSILNLVVWGVLTGIIVYVLYYEDIDKPLRRIIECEALVFCMSVCESLGVILLQCILQAADIKNVNETMLYCLKVTFSKVILFFVLYIHKQVCEKKRYPLFKDTVHHVWNDTSIQSD